MLKSESLKSRLKSRTVRANLLLFCLLTTFLTVLPLASGQAPDFTLQMASFPPPAAIDPGGEAAANITVGTVNGFTGSVDLTCQVTSQTTAPVPPVCVVSPASVQPSGGATVTVTSTGSTTPLEYAITVTGTGPTTTHIAPPQNLTVLPVSPLFTITVGTAVVPSSVPAGSGGQGVININPINGYSTPSGSAGVTLSCASITPLVTIPPVCSFNPQPVVVNGVTTSTLTINTSGPVTTGTNAHPRGFYALWVPLPMLALVGLGAAMGGKRSRKAWGLLALFVVSGSLLLMPACGNSNGTSTSTPNGVTPANSYSFTVQGVDAEGNISSNTSTTGVNPTVSLTVTAPVKP